VAVNICNLGVSLVNNRRAIAKSAEKPPIYRIRCSVVSAVVNTPMAMVGNTEATTVDIPEVIMSGIH
jgi:hypothetical protein